MSINNFMYWLFMGLLFITLIVIVITNDQVLSNKLVVSLMLFYSIALIFDLRDKNDKLNDRISKLERGK